MWVEELFGDLKGHGFDLEAIHLQDFGRLSRLVLAAMIHLVDRSWQPCDQARLAPSCRP